MHSGRIGSLSTLSRKQPGFPFGSLMPYALDRQGHPIFLISTMAMHTQNLQADPRASLFVTEPGTYTVKVEAQGFEPQQADNVVSGLGQKQTVNLTLRVAQAKQTVEVTSEAAIINPENANTSTTCLLYTSRCV